MNELKGFPRSSCPAATHAAGFSIIELLITLMLIAISVSLALPSLQQFSANNQVQAASSSIVSGLNMARFNAITTGEETTICPSEDGASCSDDSWGNGWIVFSDEDGDSNADTTELVRIVAIEGNIAASGFGEAITFESNGSTSREADTVITSCYEHESVSSKCINITINPFGSIVSSEVSSSGETEEVTS